MKNLNNKQFGFSFAIMRIALAIFAIFFDIYIFKSNIELGLKYFDYILSLHFLLSFLILFAYKYNVVKFIFFIVSLFLGNYILSFISIPPVLAALALTANFIILIFPLNNSFSIDKLTSSKPLRITYIPSYYYKCFFIIWGVFYIDAALFKLVDYSNWILESEILFKKFFTAFPNLFHHNFLVEFSLENRFISRVLAWLTVVYQLLFLVTIFLLKGRSKFYFLMFGITLHLSSAFIIDLWYLALLTIIFYIPFFSSRYFYKLFTFLRKREKNKLVLIYDNQCMFCSKNVFLIKLFDFNNKIMLKGANLEGEKEIILLFKDDTYKGVEAFKIVFKNILLYYPAYLILCIPFVFEYFNKKYLKFASNRSSVVCLISPGIVRDYKFILIPIVIIYIILTISTKFGYMELKLRLSKIGLPIPATMFLIKRDDIVRSHFSYIKDGNNNRYYLNRVFWDNDSFLRENNIIIIDNPEQLTKINTENKNYYFRVFKSEDKYINSFLINSFGHLEIYGSSNQILKNISKNMQKDIYICYKSLSLTFQEIDSMSISQIDEKLRNRFVNTKEECLSAKID